MDVPRLVAGNVALQVFTAFTQVPSAPHCDGPIPVCDPLPVGNSNASFDSVSALVPFSGAQRRRERTAAEPKRRRATSQRRTDADSLVCGAGYPLRALRSLLARALHQATRVRGAATRSAGAFEVLTSAAALDAYVARRAACLRRPGGCPFTAGLLVRTMRPNPAMWRCCY